MKRYERSPLIQFQIGGEKWYIALLGDDDTHDPPSDRPKLNRVQGPAVVLTIESSNPRETTQRIYGELGANENERTREIGRHVQRLMQIGLAWCRRNEVDKFGERADQFIAENNQSRVKEKINK